MPRLEYSQSYWPTCKPLSLQTCLGVSTKQRPLIYILQRQSITCTVTLQPPNFPNIARPSKELNQVKLWSGICIPQYEQHHCNEGLGVHHVLYHGHRTLYAHVWLMPNACSIQAECIAQFQALGHCIWARFIRMESCRPTPMTIKETGRW